MRKTIMMMMLVVCFQGAALKVMAQKRTTSVQQAWFGYLNQTRLSDKWGIWFDGHIRTKERLFSKLSTTIIRPGITYYFNNDSRFTLGYAWINNFPAEGHANISRPEHRIWQQYQWMTKYQRLRTSQYVRFEQRYRHKILNNDALADGYNFSYRLRYNLMLTIPIGNTEGNNARWSGMINNETMVGFGKEVVNNYFDQNRVLLGFIYQTNKTDNIQFGYLNVFQQLPQGNQYRATHGFRINYAHNLDLRRSN
jgi:hypothetical protein